MRDIHEENNTLNFGEGYQNIFVLGIIGIGRVGESRKYGSDKDGKDILEDGQLNILKPAGKTYP